jgi:hypothetical protein
MKQESNKLQGDSLQSFLDSATNAVELGPRQFFTPPKLAAALATVLPAKRPTCFDPQCGDSTLLKAVGAEHSFGIDIDRRSSKFQLPPPDEDDKDSLQPTQSILHGDCTAWQPLAAEVDLRFHLIACNPPFSLKWHTERFADLDLSRNSIREGYRHHLANNPAGKETIDATLATYLMSLDRLSHDGEGFMVCNAATARRLIANPETGEDINPAADHIWLWVEIPNVGYENVSQAFDTAVIYFASNHDRGRRTQGRKIHYLKMPSALPEEVERMLAPVAQNRMVYRDGSSLDSGWTSLNPPEVTEVWDAIVQEKKVREDKAPKSAFNIWLGINGRIQRNLTTFQEHSSKLDHQEVRLLNTLQGKTPMSLVVQTASRKTLLDTVHSGTWTVDPNLLAAVEAAVRDYEANRAPFFRPNAVKALGSIDEHSRIKFLDGNLIGLERGQSYLIDTKVLPTTWKTTKPNLAGGGTDKIEHTGNELIIIVKIGNNAGDEHQFHYRRDKAKPSIDNEDNQSRPTIYHHMINTFIESFEIPTPKDVAELNPIRFKKYQSLLEKMEAHINNNTIPLTA